MNKSFDAATRAAAKAGNLPTVTDPTTGTSVQGYSPSYTVNDDALVAKFWCEVYRGTRSDAIMNVIKEHFRNEHNAVLGPVACCQIYQELMEYTFCPQTVRALIEMRLAHSVPRVQPDQIYVQDI